MVSGLIQEEQHIGKRGEKMWRLLLSLVGVGGPPRGIKVKVEKQLGDLGEKSRHTNLGVITLMFCS